MNSFFYLFITFGAMLLAITAFFAPTAELGILIIINVFLMLIFIELCRIVDKISKHND